VGDVGGLGDSTSLVDGEDVREGVGDAARGKNLPFVDTVVADSGELYSVGAV